MIEHPYIGICVPSNDMCHMSFASDLVFAANDWTKRNEDAAVFFSKGTLLASQRHDLVLKAKAEGCTHVLWLDSDMRFPRDTVSRLVAHDKAVVGANCARRRMPTSPTAANYANGRKVPVYTEQDSEGLEEVQALGTGILMVSMDVYDGIEGPWFCTPWSEHHKGYMGEDMYFCWLLRENKIPIFVDHGLSKEVGHIGEWEFRHEHTWITREAKEQEQVKEPEPEHFALEVEA